MKKIIFITLFLLFQSFPSFGEWKKISSNEYVFAYIDFERIKNTDGYFYYWSLLDLKRKTKENTKSFVIYNQTDCKSFKIKKLIIYAFDQQMGNGNLLRKFSPNEWEFPFPNSMLEGEVQTVCN